MTDRLSHWAALEPDRVFLASRDGEGWRTVTYGEALAAARAIGQALLNSLSMTVDEKGKGRHGARSQARSKHASLKRAGVKKTL